MKRLDEYRILVEKSGDCYVDAIIYANNKIKIEDESVEQLKNAMRAPGVVKVLASPDIHSGFGVPIGSVVGMDNEVIPAAVGYDVNCGMRLLTTPFKKEDINLNEIAHSIHRDIPLGEGKENIRLNSTDLRLVLEKGVKGLKNIREKSGRLWEAWNDDEYLSDIAKIEEEGSMEGSYEALSKHAIERGHSQLATLGGGNHFIEIQEVVEVFDTAIAQQLGIQKEQILVMIHSGSRGLGHQVGSDYMPLARNYAKSKVGEAALGFFPADSDMGRNYIGAMHAAANFAFVNRQMMTMFVRRNFRHYYGNIPMPLVYDVPHNMAKLEDYNRRQIWIHRKGATRAFPPKLMIGTPFEHIGQPIIIPGSMGTSSYLLVGVESGKESLYSVNHGAGRVMSRTQASGKSRHRGGKREVEGSISDEEFKKSMEGILLICEKKNTIKEEAPGAYKDIDVVIDIVKNAGLAKVVAKMIPLAVLKG